MTEAPPEPTVDPGAAPAEPEPDGPNHPEKRPDLPDPAFPEVLPGGDPGPGEAPDLEPQPDQE